MRYTDNEIIETCKKVHSIKGLILALGGSYNTHRINEAKAAIARLGIDISHFDTHRERRQKLTALNKSRRVNWKSALVKRTSGNRRKSVWLRPKMIEAGIPYTCAKCPVGERWNRKDIRLEINHKNGDKIDDRPKNLEFVCPNCHSQDPHSSHNPRS